MKSTPGPPGPLKPRPKKALGPYQDAIAIGGDLLWQSHTPEAKHAETGEISALYPNLAYSLQALGRADEALVMLERVRRGYL